MKRQDDPKPPDRLDAESILYELAKRWRGARTLEYRSQAILNHIGEWRVAVNLHVCLRRPNLARITFDADHPEMSRIRVCDGQQIWDFPKSTPLHPGHTFRDTYSGLVTGNIPHPLDDVAYCVDQFFAVIPFLPEGIARLPDFAVEGKRERSLQVGPRSFPEVYRITIKRGGGRYDRLTLAPLSLEPLELIRVTDHGGRVQEVLRETFQEVRLGAILPPELFTWTRADDRGETVP